MTDANTMSADDLSNQITQHGGADDGGDKDTDTTNADATNGAGGDKGTTTADGGEADGGNVIWPEDWRSRMSGGDDKVAEELGRYAEPGLVGPALVEAKNKIRSADVRTPFPDEASDDDKAEWREKNGVPAEAAGYFEKLPEGVTVGDEDKAGMDKLAAAMHAEHAPPSTVHAAMGAYYQHVEDVEAERAEMDAADKKSTDDELHELYGPDFRRNMNDLTAWVESGGDEVKEAVLKARMPDGTPLGSYPPYIKFMIKEMRGINPLVTVPGLGGGDPALALSDEIAKIEKFIQTNNKEYRTDKTMQARYLTLIQARDNPKRQTARA